MPNAKSLHVLSLKPRMVCLSKIRLMILIVIALFTTFCEARDCAAQSQSSDTRYKLAAGYYERGQWDEAKQALNQFLINYPNAPETPQASFFLAETMMQQLEFKAAYVRYQHFLKDFSGHPLAARAMFRMGESAFRDNNTLIAVRMLDEFTRKYPAHELNQYAFCYLGQLRLVKSEPQLAKIAFERSLQVYPNGPMEAESRVGLGNAYMKQGHLSDAKRVFEYVIRESDRYKNGRSIADEAKLQLGLSALYQSPPNHAEARQWFATVAENAVNDNTRATAVLSWARSVSESDPSEAYCLLEPVVGWELPINTKIDLLIEAAIAASKTDRTEIAIGWLQQVRAIKPLNQKILDAVRFEIRLLETQNKNQQAIELAGEFNLESEKRRLITTNQETIGRQQYSEADYEASLETFGILLELQEVEAQRKMRWRYFEALSFIGLKQFTQAEASLERISDNFSDNELKFLVQFCKASVKFRLEKYESAIPNYQKYLSQDLELDDRRRAEQELAICFAKTGNSIDADRLLDRLVGQDDDVVNGIDAKLESVIELVAECDQQDTDKTIAEKWYTFLKAHSQDEQRRLRSDRWLLVRNLETPLEQQTLSNFKTLFIQHPQDIRLITTAIEKAKTFEAQQDIPAAIAWYQLALANSSSNNREINGGVQIKIAKLAHKQGGKSNLFNAKSNLQAWLDNGSDNSSLTAEVLFQLAWVHHDLGEPDQALARFNELVQGHTDSKYWPDAAYRLAKHQVAARDFLGAKSLLNNILAVVDLPQEIQARSNFLIGKIAFTEQDWPQVESAMQSFAAKTTTGNNTTLAAEYFIAEAVFQQQKIDRATIEFERLHQKVAMLPTPYQPWVWLRTASLKLAAGDVVGAAGLAKDAKERFSSFGSAYEFDFLIARGLEAEGLLSDARTAFEKVIASDSGNQTETAANAQWHIGETYFHQENYQSAIGEYYKVDSLYTFPRWRAAALLQAGKCQEHLSNPTNAIKLYRQLLARYPNSEFSTEAKQRMTKLDSALAKTAENNEHTKY